METVSHSEVESWLLCERKHYYGYGLGISRITESEALNRGILGHAVFEYYYDLVRIGISNGAGYNPVKDTLTYLMGLMDGKNSEIVNDVAKLFGYHVKVNPFSGWEILAVEKEFVVDLGNGIAMPFVIDLLGRDKRGKIAVVDHKFTYEFYKEYQTSTMPQLAKYIGGLRAMGLPADYGMYNMLRTRKVNNPEPSDMASTLTVNITEGRIKRTWIEQRDTAEEILERKSLPLHEQSRKAKRVLNKMVCQSCSFRAICVAELDADPKASLILKTEYKLRERREFSTKEIEDA